MKIIDNEFKLKGNFGVYCIKNALNNKYYVGSTIRNFWERYKEHENSLLNNSHFSKSLQNDFLNQRTDDFEFQILEIVMPSEEEIEKALTAKEIYWTNKLKADGDTGYNTLSYMFLENGDKINKGKKVSKSLKEYNQKMKKENPKEYYARWKHFIGKPAWNKGIKYSEEQKVNMRKPKKNGVSKAMKQVHKDNSKRMREKNNCIYVYDINHNFLGAHNSLIDLQEWSLTEENTYPMKLRKNENRKIPVEKVCKSIQHNKPYKGLYFARIPKEEVPNNRNIIGKSDENGEGCDANTVLS